MAVFLAELHLAKLIPVNPVLMPPVPTQPPAEFPTTVVLDQPFPTFPAPGDVPPFCFCLALGSKLGTQNESFPSEETDARASCACILGACVDVFDEAVIEFFAFDLALDCDSYGSCDQAIGSTGMTMLGITPLGSGSVDVDNNVSVGRWVSSAARRNVDIDEGVTLRMRTDDG